MQVTGSVFLVTGGSSGLGAGCARRFVRHGARVVLMDRNALPGKALADELGERAFFVHGDVTSESDVANALAEARSKWGRLHGVIHCAGILHAARMVGKEGPMPLDAFARVIHVNVVGTFNVLRMVAAALATEPANAEGERGVMVTTASVAAFDGQIGQAAYSASKGAVASMTLPLARELGRSGIRIVSIAPGVFETPMMQAAPDAVRNSLVEQIPFPPRFGDPEEYAALAQHIVENPMLNGTTIRLDGAIRMGPK
jgi:NAD(P)-dependent dehydrogenase (short-subunit alcohol dehydrogenase family)